MRWVKINKSKSQNLPEKSYSHWKSELADEGAHQCVYCTIHDGQFGGERNFHVEHFRPKEHFPQYTNSYRNLFYACGICNTFKGDAWPGNVNATLSNVGFVDPSKTDYNTIFSINPDYTITARRIAPKFMIERIYLNRPQLQYLRWKEAIMERYKTAAGNISAGQIADPKLAAKVIDCLSKIVGLLGEMDHTPPYTSVEIRRSKPSRTKQTSH
jgi:uncharacterized protein (TIGR02646 family)